MEEQAAAAEDMADSRVVWAWWGKERAAAALGASMGPVQKGGFGKLRAVTAAWKLLGAFLTSPECRWSCSLTSAPAPPPMLHLQRLKRI